MKDKIMELALGQNIQFDQVAWHSYSQHSDLDALILDANNRMTDLLVEAKSVGNRVIALRKNEPVKTQFGYSMRSDYFFDRNARGWTEVRITVSVTVRRTM